MWEAPLWVLTHVHRFESEDGLKIYSVVPSLPTPTHTPSPLIHTLAHTLTLSPIPSHHTHTLSSTPSPSHSPSPYHPHPHPRIDTYTHRYTTLISLYYAHYQPSVSSLADIATVQVVKRMTFILYTTQCMIFICKELVALTDELNCDPLLNCVKPTRHSLWRALG